MTVRRGNTEFAHPPGLVGEPVDDIDTRPFDLVMEGADILQLDIGEELVVTEPGRRDGIHAMPDPQIAIIATQESPAIGPKPVLEPQLLDPPAGGEFQIIDRQYIG